MRKARRVCRQLFEGDGLVGALGIHHDQRHAAWFGIPVHALVSHVQVFAVAIKQLPQLVVGEVRLGIGVAGVVGEFFHGLHRSSGVDEFLLCFLLLSNGTYICT
ncbi:hypothetical protein D9M68_651370 [compost metagenome]